MSVFTFDTLNNFSLISMHYLGIAVFIFDTFDNWWDPSKQFPAIFVSIFDCLDNWWDPSKQFPVIFVAIFDCLDNQGSLSSDSTHQRGIGEAGGGSCKTRRGGAGHPDCSVAGHSTRSEPCRLPHRKFNKTNMQSRNS